MIRPVTSAATSIVKALAGQRRAVILTEALLLTVVLGGADVATGSEFSFSIFYLLPITLVAWGMERRWALANAGLASITWLIADYAAGQVYTNPVVPCWNALVRLGYFVLFAVLFGRLRETVDRERDLSRVDSLTGVHNRRSFEELAGFEVERTIRYNRPLSLVFIDLDHFKRVNDQDGHDAGDRLLREVADTLVMTLRSTDTVGRLGGDEFAVVMPETGSAAALLAFEKTSAALADRMKTRGWPVTFSVGIVTADATTPSLPELLASADRLMYEAKRAGRDRIVVALAGDLAAD